MTTVVATGVFEIIHPGHILFLKEAKKLGDKLVVIVASDEMATKKRKPVIGEQQRLSVIKALKPVDDAIVGDSENILKPIANIKPDIIALGKDQNFDEEELQRMLDDTGINAKLVRIKEYWDEPLHGSNNIIKEFRKN